MTRLHRQCRRLCVYQKNLTEPVDQCCTCTFTWSWWTALPSSQWWALLKRSFIFCSRCLKKLGQLLDSQRGWKWLSSVSMKAWTVIVFDSLYFNNRRPNHGFGHLFSDVATVWQTLQYIVGLPLDSLYFKHSCTPHDCQALNFLTLGLTVSVASAGLWIFVGSRGDTPRKYFHIQSVSSSVSKTFV